MIDRLGAAPIVVGRLSLTGFVWSVSNAPVFVSSVPLVSGDATWRIRVTFPNSPGWRVPRLQLMVFVVESTVQLPVVVPQPAVT